MAIASPSSSSSSTTFNLHRPFQDTSLFQSASSARSKHIRLSFCRPAKARAAAATATARLGLAGEEAVGLIKRLQNGSDIRGVALEGEKGRKVDLTPQAVEAVAESFGEWVVEGLNEEDGEGRRETVRVSVGRDPRISGPSLSAALFSGLAHAGCLVFDMGLASTPACYMSTLLPPFAYDASIMMTASHLPYTRNGLKFFTPRGGLKSSDVEEICDRAARKYANWLIKGAGIGRPASGSTRVDFMSTYAHHLRTIIKERVGHPLHYDTPLQGFKIVVNAGNGSGGFFTWDVLEKLGADTTGSLNLEPDGMFPNHIPNPEDKTAMSLTRASVLECGAQLGIVFDTDVDRSGVVDEAGNTINGDRLIALMAAIVLREYPGTTIVTDARTSVALTRFIASRGGRHCLYRVGYRNVIDKGVQLNKDGIETHLMMETSGHGALKENHFLDDGNYYTHASEDHQPLLLSLIHAAYGPEDLLITWHTSAPGAYMVVKIIIEMVRMKLDGSDEGIGSLIKDLEDPVESIELRMNVLSQPSEAKRKGAEAVENLRKFIEEGRLEGWELDSCGDCWVSEGCLVDSNDAPAAIDAHMYRIKVTDDERGQHGWIHIRQSVHNPNIAVNLQSSVSGGCQSMSKILRDRFLMASGLDQILDITQVDSFARKGVC